MNNWTEYCNANKWHHEANLLPLMDAGALEVLAADIEKHGIQQPIVLFEDKVLDGRNRLRACERKGIALGPKDFIKFQPNGLTPRDFVFTTNLHRRQLTLDQRAAIAVELLPTFQEEAKKRVGGRPKKGQKPSADVREVKGKSAELAARFVGGVSTRSVEHVIRVMKKARRNNVPGLLKKIKQGKLTIAEAEWEADAPRLRDSLANQFGVSPFTVLDARKGAWLQRKDEWKALGVDGGHNEQSGATTFGVDNGFSKTSQFDPVLAEFVCRYFCPPHGRILDPFAGEPIKGLVAAKMGFGYTGLELRKKQVEENQKRATTLNLAPQWILGDSANLDRLLPKSERFDLVFTSPPYYDLETYSDDTKDGSAFGSYQQFMEWYEDIFRQAVARLKPSRFVVIKVGEIRDQKTGFYRNFVGDTVSCFLNLGLHYYNEAVLLTPAGSAAIKAGQYSNSRKLAHTHQNVLCFFNGDNPKVISKEFGILLPPENPKQQ